MKSKSNNNISIEIQFYRIASHWLEVHFPSTIALGRHLPSFESFKCDSPPVENPVLLKIELICSNPPHSPSEAKLLSDLSIAWEDRFSFEESEDHYITTVSGSSESTTWKMYSSKDFRLSSIYSEDLLPMQSQGVLSWLIMVAYGQAVLPYQTLMIHGSVVIKQQEGYVFLGKSGTGKSTHSRLWIEHIPDTTLLNDDNPAIVIGADGTIDIYGTPWSGKTPCYKNEKVKLSAIIRLRQSKINKMNWLEDADAFVSLMPSTSSIRWNKQLFSHMNNSVAHLVERIPTGLLDCLPDAAAAQLCYKEIKSKK